MKVHERYLRNEKYLSYCIDLFVRLVYEYDISTINSTDIRNKIIIFINKIKM